MDKLQAGMENMLALTRNHQSSRANGKGAPGQAGTTAVAERRWAPHPIPAGLESQPCPITGLYADGTEAKQDVSVSAALALAELEADPDIAEERETMLRKRQDLLPLKTPAQRLQPIQFVPLNVINRTHK